MSRKPKPGLNDLPLIQAYLPDITCGSGAMVTPNIDKEGAMTFATASLEKKWEELNPTLSLPVGELSRDVVMFTPSTEKLLEDILIQEAKEVFPLQRDVEEATPKTLTVLGSTTDVSPIAVPFTESSDFQPGNFDPSYSNFSMPEGDIQSNQPVPDPRTWQSTTRDFCTSTFSMAPIAYQGQHDVASSSQFECTTETQHFLQSTYQNDYSYFNPVSQESTGFQPENFDSNVIPPQYYASVGETSVVQNVTASSATQSTDAQQPSTSRNVSPSIQSAEKQKRDDARREKNRIAAEKCRKNKEERIKNAESRVKLLEEKISDQICSLSLIGRTAAKVHRAVNSPNDGDEDAVELIEALQRDISEAMNSLKPYSGAASVNDRSSISSTASGGHDSALQA